MLVNQISSGNKQSLGFKSVTFTEEINDLVSNKMDKILPPLEKISEESGMDLFVKKDPEQVEKFLIEARMPSKSSTEWIPEKIDDDKTIVAKFSDTAKRAVFNLYNFNSISQKMDDVLSFCKK